MNWFSMGRFEGSYRGYSPPFGAQGGFVARPIYRLGYVIGRLFGPLPRPPSPEWIWHPTAHCMWDPMTNETRDFTAEEYEEWANWR